MQPSTNLALDWPKVLIAEYKDGASDVEVCDALGMSKADFDRKYKDDELFKELVDIGRLASTAWWYRFGRKNLLNKQANTTLWMFNMKNRFGWAEKSEAINSTAVPEDQKTLDEMKQDVMAKLPGILKRLGVEMKEAQVLEFASKKEKSSE